jgi:hypothetical protein
MYGTRHLDVIRSNGGADKVYLYRSVRTIKRELAVGGAGSDRLFGGKGPDNLWGGGWSKDGVLNDRSDDYVYGGQGVDILTGGQALGGVDRLYGGDGIDHVLAETSFPAEMVTKEIIDCGPGWDTVWFDEGVDVVKDNCERKNPPSSDT